MTTPLLAEIARLRQAERVEAAARWRVSRDLVRHVRPRLAMRPALADVLRRLAAHLDGDHASTLTAR
jgi:hypothetical protein